MFAIPYEDEEIICREENILAQTHSKRPLFLPPFSLIEHKQHFLYLKGKSLWTIYFEVISAQSMYMLICQI